MRISDGSSDVCYSELGGEDLVDPLGRGDSPLRAGEDHAEHPQRPDEHRHVEVERDQVTYGEVPLDHLVAAVVERGDELRKRVVAVTSVSVGVVHGGRPRIKIK